MGRESLVEPTACVWIRIPLISLCGQKGPAGTVRDFGEGHGHTAIFKMANQLRPAEQHMDLCCMLCASLDGREVWGRTDTCICMAESLHCSPEPITTLLIGYNPMQNVFGVKKLKFGGKKRALQLKRLEPSALGFPVTSIMSASHTHTHQCSQHSKWQPGRVGRLGSGWLSSLPGVRTQSQNRRVS